MFVKIRFSCCCWSVVADRCVTHNSQALCLKSFDHHIKRKDIMSFSMCQGSGSPSKFLRNVRPQTPISTPSGMHIYKSREPLSNCGKINSQDSNFQHQQQPKFLLKWLLSILSLNCHDPRIQRPIIYTTS